LLPEEPDIPVKQPSRPERAGVIFAAIRKSFNAECAESAKETEVASISSACLAISAFKSLVAVQFDRDGSCDAREIPRPAGENAGLRDDSLREEELFSAQCTTP
jgi:hypothetical protein